MIKSPLRYPGGKSKAVELIASVVPTFKEYREPFVGGGSLFLYLKQLFPEKIYWINDLYFELYNFWKSCQNNIDEIASNVIALRKKYHNGKDLHKYLIENQSNFSSVKKAATFFIFNRITFSGTTEAGGYSEQAFQRRFTLSSIERLKVVHKILENVSITNYDYEEVIKQKGKDVFIFLDPPYFSSTKSALYGKNGNLHKYFDHERFANSIKKCEHKWLITYDDSEFIRKLFSFAYVQSWDLTYGMRNILPTSNQIGKELFITNYPIELPQSRQLQLFEKRVKYSSQKRIVKK